MRSWSSPVRLPQRRLIRSPLLSILARFAFVILIVLINWLIVVLERGQYTDSADGSVSISDALYYTTVTLTTTGYGDITPVTTSARMINALVVTPMRLLFVVLLVGTTVKALTQQSRDELRLNRWRNSLKNHVIVLGFGAKGRGAARALVARGEDPRSIVVIDTQGSCITDANDAGYAGIPGNATSAEALTAALIGSARAVIVALGRDDSAILATLTARRLNPHVNITAAARESQNAQLLRQSGATSVIVTSETAGRLLGLAEHSPHMVEVINDLASFGEGMDLTQRTALAGEVGTRPSELGVAVLAVVTDGEMRYTESGHDEPLHPTDELIIVTAAPPTGQHRR